jgi:hypothetical protein
MNLRNLAISFFFTCKKYNIIWSLYSLSISCSPKNKQLNIFLVLVKL